MTFTFLDSNITDEDRKAMYNEVITLMIIIGIITTFRCKMLPFNAGGQTCGQVKGKNTRHGEFAYTELHKNGHLHKNF